MEIARKFLVQRGDLRGIAADDERGERLAQRRHCGGGNVVAERLAPAGEPGIGLDAHQDVDELFPHAPAKAGGGAGMADGKSDGNGLERGDPHPSLLGLQGWGAGMVRNSATAAKS